MEIWTNSKYLLWKYWLMVNIYCENMDWWVSLMVISGTDSKYLLWKYGLMVSLTMYLNPYGKPWCKQCFYFEQFLFKYWWLTFAKGPLKKSTVGNLKNFWILENSPSSVCIWIVELISISISTIVATINIDIQARA